MKKIKQCDIHPFNVTANAFILTLMLILLSACSGGGSSEPPTTPVPQEVRGGGVKGPLANAVVTVYAFDATQPGFKGAVIDTALTDNRAAIVGLALPVPLTPPYIMEITATSDTTTDITTGQFPVISTLRTVITQSLLDTGEQIYATPLTSMATDIAINNADSSTAPYTGNNDGSATAQELLSALPFAATQLASTLGFGASDNIDFFDTPPLIDSTTLSATQQTAVAQYRTAIEALTALVFELAQNIANPAVSTDVMLSELTLDLADGVIDGMTNGRVSTIIDSTVLGALPTIDIPALAIPNSDNGAGQPVTVDEVEALLVSEQSITGSTTDTSALASIVITPQAAQLNPDTDGDSIANAIDNCPVNANLNQSDTNNNGVGDACDSSPLALAESISVGEGATVSLLDGGASNVLSNDTDTEKDSLTAVLDSDVSNGRLTLNTDGTFSYVHDGSETTRDSFSYHANDGSSSSATVGVTISITPQNDAPVALAERITVSQGASVSVLDSGASTVLANDTDAENDSLTAVLDSDVSNGRLTLNADGTFTYAHDDSAAANDSFTYHASDGTANSVVITVTVNIILRVNIAPVAIADSIGVNEGASVNVLNSGAGSVLANDTDVDNNLLTAVLDSNVSNGSLTLNANGSFSYTHNGGETTTDSFSYHANDGALNSATVSVSIAIAAQNDAPVATADTNSVLEDSPTTTPTGNVLSNDTDTDGPSLTVLNAATLNNTGTYGALSISPDGAYSYLLDNTNSLVDALNAGETLIETYNYTVTDGSLSDSSTLVISINGVSDVAAGTVDISGVWLVTSTVTSDTPLDCAGGVGSVDVTAVTITQTGSNLVVQAVSGAILTGTIDTVTGAFDLPAGSLSGVDADLTQVDNGTAFISWQDSFNASGTGVTATSLGGTVNTTETTSGITDCVYSESFNASFAYQHKGSENYNGVYALEFLSNNINSDGNSINQGSSLEPITVEFEFTTTDILLYVHEPDIAVGATFAILNSSFDPATGFFTFTINDKLRQDTDGDPSTIETSEISGFVINGIFMDDPGINAGSNGNPLIILSNNGYHRDFTGDVDAGGTGIRAENTLSAGYARRLSTGSRTRTRLARKADLSDETQIIMGLNNPPLKRVDANSKLFIEVLDGATLLCSEPFLTDGATSGRYTVINQQPFTRADFFAARFRGNAYSNIRCNTNDTATGADQVSNGGAYTVRVLDSGANGINDGGTGDDVIAFSTTETASVVAPAERYTQVINVFDISVNGISAANPTTTGDSVVLPGYYNVRQNPSAVISWPAHPEGAESYQLRVESIDKNDSMIRYNTRSTSITANIGGTGNKVRSLRLIARKNAPSNGARTQAASRRLLIADGISGSFAFDLGSTVDLAYQNMQITLLGGSDSLISRCTVDDNVNMSCNAASSAIDFNRNVVSLNITDNIGTLGIAGNTFILNMNFRGSSSTAAVTSPSVSLTSGGATLVP